MVRTEGGGREVMLQRCDTESIILGEITGGGERDDTCPIDKTIQG